MKLSFLTTFFIFACLFPIVVHAQPSTDLQYYDPVQEDNIQFHGQGWEHTDLASPYDRLPAKAEQTVRKAVWNLSRHSAGIYLTFSTDAPEIIVRYQTTSSRLEMPHMPATGVSGLDLYVDYQDDGGLMWCRGKYSFKDTITYTYSALNSRHPKPGKIYDYRLFLPLYNGVKWMEIGIPESASFSNSKSKPNQPIVVYGTSRAQGGCASRPAMAWSSILQRDLDNPVINLAFSGNGQLETEVISLISEIDARLYILDCLPNLGSEKNFPDEELKKRVRQSVESLKKAHPNTPVLLTDNAGYSDEPVSGHIHDVVVRVNGIQKAVYEELKAEGVTDLFYLTNEEINMCMDCTVDGTHETDLGMTYYGLAYAKKIREIFDEGH